MKKFILGFILGSLIFGATAALAEEALQVKLNPFPILINGIKSDVEGYNINGFTFLKLADFKKTGLKVAFNETEKQIEIESMSLYEKQQAEAEKTMDIKSLNPQEQYVKKNVEKTSDGLPIVYIDGGQYIPMISINSKLHKLKTDDYYYHVEILKNGTVDATINIYKKNAKMNEIHKAEVEKYAKGLISELKSYREIEEENTTLIAKNIPFETYTDSEGCTHYYVPYNYYNQNIFPYIR